MSSDHIDKKVDFQMETPQAEKKRGGEPAI